MLKFASHLFAARLVLSSQAAHLQIKVGSNDQMEGLTETESVRTYSASSPMEASAEQFYRTYVGGRKSVDDYPSYGATPRATPARNSTPGGTPNRASYDGEYGPRRSASMILRGLGFASGRRSGRLSDEEELHHGYCEDAVSSWISNASPLRISFSIAGPVQIPEDELYTDVEAARAYAVREHPMDESQGCTEGDIGKPVRDDKPPMRISLKFIDVRYKIVQKQSTKWTGKTMVEKEIIHGITGSVVPGEMLAMMGPSGSGKTTLLNLLGGRKSNPRHISGSTLYNNLPYSKNLKSRMGFVTQDDVLFPHLTVRETLTFSAVLRLPRKLKKHEKIERAEDVIAQLGLQRCADTIIGTQFLRGVSGGERKRVCIGQEILIDPSLIFLDEPTSGLDSTTALRIIQLLKNIACEGRTVVTTIHQPSSRAFHMFDKLLLLSEGHAVYYGKARGAISYFEAIGFAAMITMNPADFLLDLCSGNTNEISIPTNLVHVNHHPMYAANSNSHQVVLHANFLPPTPSSQLAKDVKKYLVECCENQISSIERVKLSNKQGSIKDVWARDQYERRIWGSTWCEQFLILFIRGLKERRHEYLSWLRIVQVVLSALLGGCLWWHSKNTTLQQLRDQVGLVFFITVFWGYMPLFTAIFTFPLERAMVAKERASDMYHLSAYFMARTLGDLPLDLALPLVFMVIIYFMGNLRHSVITFACTVLTIFLTVVTAQGLGLFIGAMMMDVQKATTFASVVVLAFMLTGGFFVQHIPPFIAWMKYLSFQAHVYKILIQLQYSHETSSDCNSDGECHNIESARALMSHSSLYNIGYSVMALLIMVFGYRLLAYIALRRMKTSA